MSVQRLRRKSGIATAKLPKIAHSNQKLQWRGRWRAKEESPRLLLARLGWVGRYARLTGREGSSLPPSHAARRLERGGGSTVQIDVRQIEVRNADLRREPRSGPEGDLYLRADCPSTWLDPAIDDNGLARAPDSVAETSPLSAISAPTASPPPHHTLHTSILPASQSPSSTGSRYVHFSRSKPVLKLAIYVKLRSLRTISSLCGRGGGMR